MSCHWHHRSAIGLRVWELSWSQCPWGPKGGHHFICLKILILQQGCSSKWQIWALSLCMSWQMHIWLPSFFNYFFYKYFVDSVAILPLVKTRGLNEDFSMSITLSLVVLILLFLKNWWNYGTIPIRKTAGKTCWRY